MSDTAREIDETAAYWAVRVDAAPLDQAERESFAGWLAESSRHRGAYARAQAMLIHAGRAKALGKDFDPDSYFATHATAWEQATEPRADVMSIARPTRRRVLAWGGAAAAASVVAAIGLGWQDPAQAYASRRGEIRSVPLEDGSRMTLNTESKASVRYEKDARHVELEAGEALFDVARDVARPFLVVAGEIEVRAIGTSFSVERLPGKPVKVIVREGVVEIRSLGRANRQPARVAANMRAIAAPASSVATAPLAPAEVGRALAWREGLLAFEDMPLDEAAEQFARYSDEPIRFADPAIGRETVTGLFAANNPKGFAQSAALSLGLTAEVTTDGVILKR